MKKELNFNYFHHQEFFLLLLYQCLKPFKICLDPILWFCSKCDYKCSARGCGVEMTCAMNSCLVDPEILTSVNRDQFAGWKATNYSAFWGHTLNEGFTRRLGTRHSRRRVSTFTCSFILKLDTRQFLWNSSI